MYVCMYKNSVNIRRQSKRHMMQIDSELLNCCLDTVLGKIHFWEIITNPEGTKAMFTFCCNPLMSTPRAKTDGYICSVPVKARRNAQKDITG